MPSNLAQSLSRVLRPQAAYRWLMPYVGAITPQYIEYTLRGALAGNHVQAWELFDLMLDTWPELASCTNELTEAVCRRKLIIEADADDDTQATEDALQRQKVCSAALRRMRPDAASDENDLNGTIADLMAGWFQGQVALEVNYDAEYGSQELNILSHPTLGDITAPRSTFWVHPVCYSWSMEGRLGLRVELNALRDASRLARSNQKPGSVFTMPSQTPMPLDVDGFPPDKFLIGVHKAKAGTALGGAMLRPLAWWWCASNFSADWLLNLSQLFGIPFRWVNYSQSLPQEMLGELDSMLQNMGSAGWARFPEGTEIKLLEAGKGGDNSPQDALLDRCDRYARLLILGQTMSGGTDSSKGGGKAFGSVESGVKEKRVDAACKYVAGIFNSQWFPSICRLNFGDAGPSPMCRFLQEEEGTLQDAQRDIALAQGGLKIGEKFLRKKYNIPSPEEGEDTIGGEPADPKPDASTVPAAASPDADPGAAIDPNDAVDAKAVPGSQLADNAIPSLADAVKDDLSHMFDRLNAVLQIPDDEIFAKKLQEFSNDFPALKASILADPKAARALQPILGAALANGLASKIPMKS